MHEGYPLSGQGVSISLDSLTGELVSFYASWNQTVNAGTTEVALTADDARELIDTTVSANLVYLYSQPQGALYGDWKPAYRIGFGPVVEAATGELIHNDRPYSPQAVTAVEPFPHSETPWSPPAEPLTQEEALALAYKLTGFDAEYRPQSVQRQQGVDPEPFLEYWITWVKIESGNGWTHHMSHADVQIDALTGLVKRYSNYPPSYLGMGGEPEGEPVLDEAGARQRIIEFVQVARPDLVPHLRTRNFQPYGRLPWDEDNGMPIRRDYEMQFEYTVDSVPLEGVSLTVSVDLYTGEIRNFWVNGMDRIAKLELPSLDGIMTPDEAKAVWLAEAPIRLGWLTRMVRPGENPNERQHYLAYSLQAPGGIYVEAGTGHVLDYQGRNAALAAARPNDLDGHWAELEIQWLLARGVFAPVGETFNPDGEVTVGEAIRWMLMHQQPYQRSQYDFEIADNQTSKLMAPYVETAIRRGLIKLEDLAAPFDAEAPMTREAMALMIVRALGYSEIADMDITMNLPFTDAEQIGARYQNAVGIMAGLGLVSKGEAVTFRPSDPLTRAEAAKLLYAFILQQNRSTGGYYYYY